MSSVLLGVDRLQHPGDHVELAARHVAEHIPVPMHDAALPLRLGVARSRGLNQAQTGITDDQADAGESARFEVAEQALPALQVLLVPFGHPQDVAIAVRAHTDRDEYRHVPHLAAPTPFEANAIEVDIRIGAGNRALASGLDLLVDPLVEPADRPRAPPGCPRAPP